MTSDTTFSYTELPCAVDEGRALIYLWEVYDGDRVIYCYVGKAHRGAKRPRKHYQRNVANLLGDRPYRRSNPGGYREVHRSLAVAARKGYRVTLRFLRSVEPHENIDEIERQEQERYRCDQYRPLA